MNELIPPSRKNFILRALNQVFPGPLPQEIHPMTGGGSSAKMFQFLANENHYVLRLMSLDQPLEDRLIQIKAMQNGGVLGIAPSCHYANAEDGIIIMSYIRPIPLSKELIKQKMPGLLNKLHYSNKIPEPFYPIVLYMEHLIATTIQMTGSQQLKEYCSVIQELMVLLNAHKQWAACHNDLNRENILYDGTQLYLIDFEAAGWDDPYFDLATVCQQNCFTAEEEYHFLLHYLGHEPTSFNMAKLSLMKQISYAYIALHFFQHAYTLGLMDFQGIIPSLKDWTEKKESGFYKLENAQDFILYAMVLLHQSVTEMANHTFDEMKQLF